MPALIALLLSALPALAQGPTYGTWSFVPFVEFWSNAAIVATPGPRVPEYLTVECAPSGGLRMHLSTDGDPHAKADTFTLTVGATTVSVPAHHDSEGAEQGWWAAFPAPIVTAIATGAQLTIQPAGRYPSHYALIGAPAALAQVQAACTAAATPAAANGALTPAAVQADVTRDCGGPFTMREGGFVQTDLDLDGQWDYLIDYGSIDCADRSKGRGAGFCGMQMCSLNVYVSSVWHPGGQPQYLLAVGFDVWPSPHLPLKTHRMGGDCPFSTVCTTDWHWNGSQLVAGN